MGCLLGLAPLIFLRQKNEIATATAVIAVAGKDARDIPSQCQKSVVLRSQPAGPGSSGETVFATISKTIIPCTTYRPEMAQNLGGSVFILTVTVAMAVKRLREFMKDRKMSE